MRLDHPNYIKLAIAAYHDKRLNNELPPLLAHPTPANIRRECATVYQERFDKKDEPMLRAFFGPGEQGRKYLALIENFDVDRFRPLNNFLREEGKKGITDKNLELLAWLIDFKYRPFVFGMEVSLTEKERQVLEIENPGSIPGKDEPGSNSKQASDDVSELGIIPGTGIADVEDSLKNEAGKTDIKNNEGSKILPTPIPGKRRTKNIFRTGVVIFLSLLAFYGGMYIYQQYEQSTQIPLGNANTGCMYWASDHYEKVSCNEDPQGRLFLPLNEEKRKNFFKIMREDTITERSIGRIYYLKTDNKKEFFTAGGNHPVYINRPLKVFSQYIYEREFRKKDSLAEQYMKSLTNK